MLLAFRVFVAGATVAFPLRLQHQRLFWASRRIALLLISLRSMGSDSRHRHVTFSPEKIQIVLPRAGIEPAHPFGSRILSPVCLPVPSPRQIFKRPFGQKLRIRTDRTGCRATFIMMEPEMCQSRVTSLISLGIRRPSPPAREGCWRPRYPLK